jgi:apolipoprotein N-acyltransferase
MSPVPIPTVARLGAAALSGLMLTGAFPGVGLPWLAWVALVPLLICLGRLPAAKSFRMGFVAGLIHYLTLCYWLVHTMQTYGGLPVYLSVPLLFLLAAYLALFTAGFALLVNRLCPTPLACFVLAPVVWTGLEYLRSFLFTGFPWELLGYAQYNALHLIQISDIFGVYGVSFLTALINAAAGVLVLFLGQSKWHDKRVSATVCLSAVVVSALAAGSTWTYGRVRLQAVDALAGAAPKVSVSVAQGNIAQGVKWDPAFRLATTDTYVRLTERAAADNAELVVWPETAAPFYFRHDTRMTRRVLQGARQAGVSLLVGSPSASLDDGVPGYYNSAYLIGPDGTVRARYDKAHLVPFGEYVPFKRYLPFLGKIVAQVGDFSSGPKGRTLPWQGHELGMLICYEIIFPELAREMARNGAGLLINMTNDAWYGRSSAPYQHFSMAVFRAVENRRALIRSANTGISGFIDPAGRILQASPLFVETIMTQNTPVLQKKSIYTRLGDAFALACLLAAMAAGAYRGLRAIIQRR